MFCCVNLTSLIHILTHSYQIMIRFCHYLCARHPTFTHCLRLVYIKSETGADRKTTYLMFSMEAACMYKRQQHILKSDFLAF